MRLECKNYCTQHEAHSSMRHTTIRCNDVISFRCWPYLRYKWITENVYPRARETVQRTIRMDEVICFWTNILSKHFEYNTINHVTSVECVIKCIEKSIWSASGQSLPSLLWHFQYKTKWNSINKKFLSTGIRSNKMYVWLDRIEWTIVQLMWWIAFKLVIRIKCVSRFSMGKGKKNAECGMNHVKQLYDRAHAANTWTWTHSHILCKMQINLRVDGRH